MTNLRKLAEGKPCQIRLPLVCNFDPATTVLAHYRMAGMCGSAQKPPDECAAWACSTCHDVVDGRVRHEHYSLAQAKAMHLEGVLRTLQELSRLGYKMKL